MALKNILTLGSLLAATFMISGTSNGQVNVPSPRFQHKAVESPESTRPFATPGVFDYDAQLFAPIEFTNGEEMEPGSGFYATYDRTYSSINRGTAGVGTGSLGTDYIWGTRMELGWMTDNDDGWGIAYQQADGSYFTAGQDILVQQPMMVTTDTTTFELNKIFRQTLKGGGYFEPYIGGRYFSLSDKTIEDTSQILNNAGVGNRFKQETTNSAFGFQAGARYNNRMGRWRMTSDGAIATMYNQQRYFSTDIANRSTPTTVTQAIIEANDSDQAFVPVLDFQLEFAYHISRDLAIRTGVQANYAWNGIARANVATTSLNPNSAFSTTGAAGGLVDDDDSISAGFIFGVEWKR
jgi:hypothetical protein